MQATKDAVKRVHELTSRFETLTQEELKELRILAKNLSAECAGILYDWRKGVSS